MIKKSTVTNALPDGYSLEGEPGVGCFHFAGSGEYGDTINWPEAAVWVDKVNHLDLDEWVEYFMDMAGDAMSQ